MTVIVPVCREDIKANAARRRALWHEQNARCFYCDRTTKLNPKTQRDPLRFTLDHIVRPVRMDDPIIAVGACNECNNERGHLPAHEYVMIHGLRISSKAKEPLNT